MRILPMYFRLWMVFAFFCFTLFSFFPAFSYAQTNLQVAIDFKSLVQGIPARNKVMVSDSNRLLNVGAEDYAVYPGVIELIQRLEKNPAVSLVIITAKEDEALAQQLFPKISATISNLQKDVIPSNWTPQNSIYLTINEKCETPLARVIAPVPSYFYFESFEKNISDAKRSKNHKQMFPSDEKTFLASLHRFELFYLQLLSVLQAKTPVEHLSQAILNSATSDSLELKFLRTWRSIGYADETLRLKTNDGKIEACQIISYDPLTLSMNDSGALSLAEANCLQFVKQQAEVYAWLDKDHRNCGLFYSSFFFSTVEAAKCTSDVLAVRNQGAYVFQSDLKKLSLSHLNKSPAVIGSVSLPRMDAPLFRGIGSKHFHFRANSILRGLLDIDHHVLPSAEFSKAMKRNFSRRSSVDEAIDALKDYFSSQKTSTLHAKYTKADSGQYISWPTDVVFGTLFYQVAESYGMGWTGGHGIVLAFHDYLKRGVDLNYVMGLLGEVNGPVDAGEYLMPLLIDTSEFDGLIFPGTHHAYFRVSEQGRNYLLVYKNVGCIFKNSADQAIYICNSQKNPYSYYSIHQAPETPAEHAVASAVIAVCKPGDVCLPPEATFLQNNFVQLESEFMLDVPIEKLSDSKNAVKVYWKP